MGIGGGWLGPSASGDWETVRATTETDKRAEEREAHVRERTDISKVGKEGPVGGKAAPRGSRRGSWSGRGHVGAHGIEERVATGYVIGSYV